MRILKGVHEVPERRLVFQLEDDLTLGRDPLWIRLEGANGSGKSSFIEQVLIPALKREGEPFVYFGQDFHLQYGTIRAMLALEGERVSRAGPKEVIDRWLNRNRHARVLILDELDTFLGDLSQVFAADPLREKTYVVVSHNRRLEPPDPGAGVAFRVLHFLKGSGALPPCAVHIREVSPWPLSN